MQIKHRITGAVLREVDDDSLQGADLDFSSWPLWCGSDDV